MHDACTINPYFHIDFCECDTRTILLASVGLAQACPNNYNFMDISIHLDVMYPEKFFLLN